MALLRTSGQPRARTIVGVLALAGGVAQAFGRFGYALLLPAMNRDLLHSYSLAGLLGTLNLLAYLLGALFVSLTAARWAPATFLRSGLLLSTAGLAVLALGPTAAVLGVGMALAGAGGALIWVPTPGLAGAAVAPAQRGLAIGLAGSGIGIAVIACSLLTVLVHAVAGPDSWRAVWGIEAGIGLVAWLCALRWLHLPERPVAGAVRISALRSVPGWKGTTASYACYGLAISIYMTFLVTALEQDAGFASAHASAVFALVGIFMALGGVLIGRVSDLVGRRRSLLGSYLLMTVGVLLVPLGAEPWAVLSAIGFGLSTSGAPAVTAAHLADHLEPRAFAAAFGAITLFFGMVQIVGPQLGGWLGDTTGSFGPAFLLSAAAALVAAGAAATLPRRAAAGQERTSHS